MTPINSVLRGRAARSAREAHNLEVASSNLAPATSSKSEDVKLRQARCVAGADAVSGNAPIHSGSAVLP
jgi:hypothetical protein